MFEDDYDYEDEVECDEDQEDYMNSNYYGDINNLVLNASGTSFVLVMKHQFGTDPYSSQTGYSFHPRYRQPCYGELRKYLETHPKECSQPKDNKPGDLFCPFPDGIPFQLGLPFGQYPNGVNQEVSDFIQHCFSNDSPWRKGFDSVKFVRQCNLNFGVTTGCNIDPTVTVSLCWYIRQELARNLIDYNYFRGKGFTHNEAALLGISGVRSPGCNSTVQAGSQGYHWAGAVSLKRFFNQNPEDLTGGTLADRYDYNRKSIQYLFYDSKGLNLSKTLLDKGFYKKGLFDSGNFLIDTPTLADDIKEIIYKHLEQEPDPVNNPYKVPKTFLKSEVALAA